MNHHEAAAYLREIAQLVELTDPIPQKAIAYRKAAASLDAISNIDEVLDKLETLPGIGKKMAEMIQSLLFRGRLHYYEELQKKIPPSLIELANLPGLGIKKIRQLYQDLGIASIEDLKKELENPGIKKWLPPYLQKKIIARLAVWEKEGPSLLYPTALNIADQFIAALRPMVIEIAMTGDLRRKCELIHDLQFVAVSDHPAVCRQAFQRHPLVKESQGQKVILKNGLSATLKLVEKEAFSLALLVDTGSRQHVAKLIRAGLPIARFTYEREYYQALGLPWISPELREDRGEIEAAKENRLPHLIEEGDLRGAFHCHTTASDGNNSLEEMVNEARRLGWEYIGISDHSKSSHQAHGLKEEALLQQVEAIRLLNQNFTDFQVFSGIECDILKDGQLDFSNEILKELDFVIISVHRYFAMQEEEMTQRLIKAIENPYTTMVGHLTGRQLRTRDPYALNMEKIIDACAANHKVIELNGTPNRLDMDWRYWKQAKEKGVLCCINPDAHSLRDFMNCTFGVNSARKGWLEKRDVINTKTLKQMRNFLDL